MKNSRHKKILELINMQRIETQEELARALKDAGFEVTQATVSRDIRQLQLTKLTDERGKQYYGRNQANETASDGDKFIRVLKEGFVSATAARNLLVIKTVSGMAMAVAAALDHLQFQEIIGSIAGDDTIFCALGTDEEAKKLADKLHNLCGRNE